MAEWRTVQLLTHIPNLMRRYFYALQRLGYYCEAKMLENNSLSACTAVNPVGHRLAVEVDIPNRRFVNAPDKVYFQILTSLNSGSAGFGSSSVEKSSIRSVRMESSQNLNRPVSKT